MLEGANKLIEEDRNMSNEVQHLEQNITKRKNFMLSTVFTNSKKKKVLNYLPIL